MIGKSGSCEDSLSTVKISAEHQVNNAETAAKCDEVDDVILGSATNISDELVSDCISNSVALSNSKNSGGTVAAFDGVAQITKPAPPILSHNIDEDFICSICSETMLLACSMRECSHSFCEYCIYTWLRRKSVCPNCRQAVKNPPLVNLRLCTSIENSLLQRPNYEQISATRNEVLERRSSRMLLGGNHDEESEGSINNDDGDDDNNNNTDDGRISTISYVSRVSSISADSRRMRLTLTTNSRSSRVCDYSSQDESNSGADASSHGHADPTHSSDDSSSTTLSDTIHRINLGSEETGIRIEQRNVNGSGIFAVHVNRLSPIALSNFDSSSSTDTTSIDDEIDLLTQADEELSSGTDVDFNLSNDDQPASNQHSNNYMSFENFSDDNSAITDSSIQSRSRQLPSQTSDPSSGYTPSVDSSNTSLDSGSSSSSRFSSTSDDDSLSDTS